MAQRIRSNVLQPKPLMCRKLRSTVPVQPNVLQPKLPNAVHRSVEFYESHTHC